MKLWQLIFLSFFLLSCATLKNDDRNPASEEQKDVSKGMNTDSFGSFTR